MNWGNGYIVGPGRSSCDTRLDGGGVVLTSSPISIADKRDGVPSLGDDCASGGGWHGQSRGHVRVGWNGGITVHGGGRYWLGCSHVDR